MYDTGAPIHTITMTKELRRPLVRPERYATRVLHTFAACVTALSLVTCAKHPNWPTSLGHIRSVEATCPTVIRGTVNVEPLDRFTGVHKGPVLSDAEIHSLIRDKGGVLVTYAGRSIKDPYFKLVGVTLNDEIPVYAEAAIDGSSTVFFKTRRELIFVKVAPRFTSARPNPRFATFWMGSNLSDEAYHLCEPAKH